MYNPYELSEYGYLHIMDLYQLGKSDLQINKMAFGAWAIGGNAWGGNPEKDSYEAISASILNGLVSIDTAPIYGFGKSEEIVGKVIKDLGVRDKVKILTKFGINWNTTKGKFYFESSTPSGKRNVFLYSGKEGVIKECEDSLRRLQCDYIDLYQVHRPDPTTPISETMEALEKLKQDGKILNSGVSNFTLDNLREAGSTSNIISNQLPYSMLERSIEEAVIPYCEENKIGILAYSPLQRGVLTGKYSGQIKLNTDDHRKDTKWFKAENRERINHFLSSVQNLADYHSASISQIVLNWTSQQRGISCILVGARNASQVIENISSFDFKLDQSELNQINKSLEKLVLV